MSLLVPVFAFGILKAGEFAFTQAIGMMTGSTQSAGSAAGSSIGLGNVNYGNMALANQSYENVSANKQSMSFKHDAGVDTNYFNYSWGQTSGGLVETRGVDSHPAMSYKTSNLPGFGMQITNTFQNSLSEQRAEAERSSTTNAISAGNEYSAALNSLNQLSTTRAKGSTEQTSTQQADIFQESTTLQQLDSISTSLSKTHDISEQDSRAIVGRVFADLSIGGRFKGTGGGIGTHLSTAYNDNSALSNAYQDAVNQMNKLDISNMKQEIQSYASQHSVGETDSDNTSFADSISAHLNNAVSYSEQAQQSYSKAQSLDKAENRLKSDTFALSEDLSVRFSNWLLDENNGDARAYRLEMDMMAVNPEYREHRINEFLSKNHESLLENIGDIKKMETPEGNIDQLKVGIPSVPDTHDNAMNRVNTQKEAVGLNKPYTSSDIPVPPTKKAFDGEIADMEKNMDVSKRELDQEKQKAEDRVKDKTDIPIIDSWLKKGGED